MADQTTVDRERRRPHLGRNVSSFAHDVVTLGELQLRLLAVDVRDSAKAAGAGGACLVAGVLAAVGAIPLVFVTLALALIEFAGWSQTLSFALATLLGLISGAVLAWVGWKQTLSAGKTLGRSKAELVQTLHWIKETLRPKEESTETFTPRF
jgi:hypothetical protein